MFNVTLCAAVPDPTDWAVVDVRFWRVLLVPHSNQAVVAVPSGSTFPLRIAPSPAKTVAAVVCAVGLELVAGGKFSVKVRFQLPGSIAGRGVTDP
jgi:hypothetical protein